MSFGLKIKTLIYTILFGIFSMAVMLHYSDNKAIAVADMEQDVTLDFEENETEPEPVEEQGMEPGGLILQENEEKTNYLCIPLPAGIRADRIRMENHYMEKQLWVFLQDIPENFYGNRAVSGNLNQIIAGDIEYRNEGVCLKFDLTDVYECKSILENDYLYVEFVAPREIYDKIIVIDAGHGGADEGWTEEELFEKDIALDVVTRLKEKLDGSNIKVYYTRVGDENPSGEDRIHLANAVKADMFISIHVNYNEEDSDQYGTETFYNSSFFIPGFGSLELADTLEREVVTSINGKGNGLFEADPECYELQNASVPAAQLRIGYLSNRQEAILLGKEDYRQRVADGIYNAILRAYE